LQRSTRRASVSRDSINGTGRNACPTSIRTDRNVCPTSRA
jgi:hypothetical protein